MNELDHLRRMRADVPEPGPEELAMRTGWRPDGERPVSRTRPVSLLPLALSGAAVLAAAAVFAFLVLGPVDVTEPDTVSVGPAPESSDGSGSTEGTDDAMEVMEPVIEAARSQNVDGRVWYERVVQGVAWGVGPDGDRYGVYSLHTTENWTHLEEGVSTGRPVSSDWELVSEEDRSAWEGDGSPTRWTGIPGSVSGEIPDPEGTRGELREPMRQQWAFGTDTLALEELQELSSDPRELAELLLEDYRGAGTEQEIAAVKPVLTYPLPPEVRAGVYLVLADIPGVRAVEGVTDVSGRPAVGVAYDVGTGLGEQGMYEERILLDPETGALLAFEQTVVEPAASEADWSRPGDVVGYWLYESADWANEWPQ